MNQEETLFTEFFNKKLKDKGLSLNQISSKTGIAMKHLENFSHGRFENLPSAPYVHGYFVRLGEILEFDPEEWWTRIKAEDTVHRSGSRDRMPGNRFLPSKARLIIWSAVAVALIAIYFGLRFTTILGEPRLALERPGPEISNTSASSIVFEGTARNTDSLLINGSSVPLGQDGEFSTEVRLSSGPNTIEVRARKTLGREITLTRQIYYDSARIILPVPGATTTVPAATGTLPAAVPTTTDIDNSAGDNSTTTGGAGAEVGT